MIFLIWMGNSKKSAGIEVVEPDVNISSSATINSQPDLAKINVVKDANNANIATKTTSVDVSGFKDGQWVKLDIKAVGEEMAELSTLKPTHFINKSESAIKRFVNGVKTDGSINQSISYIEHNGSNFIVDGNHRFFAAQKLGIRNVPIQQVQLPFRGYQTSSDLLLSGKQVGWWKYFNP